MSHAGAGVERVREKLPDAVPAGNDSWKACCPAHEDNTPSLSISQGDNGAVLNCFAGCKPEAVVQAIGLEMRHLFDDFDDAAPPRPPVKRITLGKKTKATGTKSRKLYSTREEAVASVIDWRTGAGFTLAGQWDYRDAAGVVVGTILRFNDPAGGSAKEFRPVSGSGAEWTVSAPAVWPLYRGSELDDGTEPVFVPEGEKKADAIRGLGLSSVAAAGGAKSPKKTDWAPLAGRRVVLVPDNDEPGEGFVSEVARLLSKLEPAATVSICRLPGLEPAGDIADLVDAAGDDDDRRKELRSILEEAAAEPDMAIPAPAAAAVDAISAVQPAVALAGKVTVTVERTAGRIRRLVTVSYRDVVIASHRFDPGVEPSRSKFANATAERYPNLVNAAELEAALMAESEPVAASMPQESEPFDQFAQAAAALDRTDDAVVLAAEEYLLDPELHVRIARDLQTVGIAGEAKLAMLAYLVGTSRLLSKPLALIAQGPSSSGKSFVVERAGDLFPPEAVIHAKSITANALYYMEPGALRNRFVLAGERSRMESDETAEATRALREMISSGKLSKLVPMKLDGVMTTKLIEQPGPIAYAESTTVAQIFAEDRNRCIICGTDERDSQTRRIVQAIAAKAAGGGPAGADAVIARHHAIQRMLEPLEVVIPFAREVGHAAEKTMGHVVEARRAFGMLLDTVKAIALLYQRQRQRNAAGAIEATRSDFELACAFLETAARQTMGYGTSEAEDRCEETIRRLIDQAALPDAFTVAEASRAMSRRDDTVRGWLKRLAASGKLAEVESESGSKGGKPAARYRLPLPSEEVAGPNAPRIPSPSDVWPTL